MADAPIGRIALAVDVVLLTRGPEVAEGDPRALEVLLVRRAREPHVGSWALPGGLVRDEEDLPDAVARVLDVVAGPVRHLEQLQTFGTPGRDPRGRVVSVTHLALLPERVGVADRAAWWRVAAPPPLAFDHADLLTTALERLRGKLSYSNVAFGLLPEEFTLTELQDLYEVVLDHPLDKRNFRRKVLSLGILETGSGLRRGPHRPAQLYRFARPELVLLDDVIPT